MSEKAFHRYSLYVERIIDKYNSLLQYLSGQGLLKILSMTFYHCNTIIKARIILVSVHPMIPSNICFIDFFSFCIFFLQNLQSYIFDTVIVNIERYVHKIYIGLQQRYLDRNALAVLQCCGLVGVTTADHQLKVFAVSLQICLHVCVYVLPPLLPFQGPFLSKMMSETYISGQLSDLMLSILP